VVLLILNVLRIKLEEKIEKKELLLLVCLFIYLFSYLCLVIYLFAQPTQEVRSLYIDTKPEQQLGLTRCVVC